MERVGLGYEIPAACAPTVAERGTLAAREATLEAALRPAGRDEAQRMVAALFAVIVRARDEGDATREQIKLYAATLASQPIWAIAAACRGYVDGGGEFRPAAGELVARAKAACAAAQAERAKILRVLAAVVAPEIPREERARVAAQFRSKLMAALAPQPPASAPVRSQEAGG